MVYAQLGLEGLSLPWRATTGSLSHFLCWLSSAAFGPGLFSLHLPHFCAIGLEMFLLWRLANALFGKEAAAGALLFNALSAFTLVRLRGLFSFALLPCELLLVLNLLLLPRRWAPALVGLLSGLFLLDYEAWLLAAPIAAGISLFGPRPLRRGWSFLPGLALGWGLALWLSREQIQAWLLIRKGYSAPAGAGGAALELFGNLKSFFWGGESIGFLGPDGHPASPRWALPLLALGLWRAKKEAWLPAWIALGLLPLAALAYGSEPNRGIAAWPALCLLAGLGWAWAWTRLGRLSIPAFAALALLGAADEAQAFYATIGRNYPAAYGRSEALMHEAALLKKQNGGRSPRVLASLDFFCGPELRYFLGPQDPAGKAPPLAWIPDSYLPALGQGAGTWTILRADPKAAPEHFLEPTAAWEKRLSAVDAQIRELELRLPLHGNRRGEELSLEWLDRHPQADPWLRTALWSRIMNYASLSGDISDARLEQLLSEKLLSADPFYSPGIQLLRLKPAFALRLLKKAKSIDPRCALDEESMARIQALLP